MIDLALFQELESFVVRVPILASQAGSTILVPAQPGVRWRCIRYVLVASEPVDISFRGADDRLLEGPYHIPRAGDGLDPLIDPFGHFETEPGEPIAIHLSAAVSVGGRLACIDPERRSQ